MTNTLLTLADPTALATIVLLCVATIAVLVRQLRADAAEDARVARFVESMRLTRYTWDTPTAWSGLSERTDTASFPAIVLAGTVTR